MLPTSNPRASTSALILFALALALPARALAGGEGDAKEQRRILRLRSGQTIRVVSRQVDGKWEYRGKQGWKDLEPGAVESARSEGEVLREFESKRSATSPRDLGLRTQLADWALTAGLVTEGLEEMTAVLALDPDRKQALDSLGAHPSLMNVPSVGVPAEALPGAKQELFRFGASIPGAARELAVLELGKLPRDEALQTDLLSELRSRVDSRRAFSALALRRLMPGAGIKPLVLHAVLDPSDEVRRSSSLALRAANEPGLILPIVRVLANSTNPLLRKNAAEALGDMGYKAAVEPLVARLAAAAQSSGEGRLPHSNIFVGRQFAYIQDFDVEVAQFQAVADPQVGVLIEGSVLETAVAGVQETQVAVEVASVRNSLAKLTGENPGQTTKAWLAWWEANGQQWRSDDLTRPKAPEGPATGG